MKLFRSCIFLRSALPYDGHLAKLVAQRIAYANGWSILFRDATMYQERNEHDLMRDFKDEIPGYLHNRNICETLTATNLKSGVSAISENLVLCYETLVAHGFFDRRELELLSYWISDLRC